jgi:hypothetical protein
MTTMRNLLLTVSLTLSCTAQGWVDRSGPGGPSPRSGHAMAFDPVRGHTVMAGTFLTPGTGQPYYETWVWDGTVWTQRGNPPPQVRAMVWHAATQQLLGATWHVGTQNDVCSLHVWDGVAWAIIASESMPSGPFQATGISAAYDPVRQETVIRPLSQFSSSVPAVLVFDGVTLLRRQTLHGPPNVVVNHSGLPTGEEQMAWDPAAGRIVLARDEYYFQLVGTQWLQLPIVRFYEWSGWGWNLRSPTTVPGRVGAMTSDVGRRRVLMLDGEVPGMTSPGANQPYHTWAIGNGTCSQLLTPLAPTPRVRGAMAFDTVRNVCVLFGGLVDSVAYGDTWEFDLGPAAASQTYGAGCPGNRGVPALGVQAGSVPRVGTTYTLQASNLPWSGDVFFFLGLSDTSYGGSSLPLDLGMLGAPGCRLLASSEAVHLLANVLGNAQWSYVVPPFPGVSLFAQVLPVDFGANNLGITTSNGVRSVIGF